MPEAVRPAALRYRAELTCMLCTRFAGDLGWESVAARAGGLFRLVSGEVRTVPFGSRLLCAHCGGRLLAGEPELVRAPSLAPLPQARRGRPRRAAVPQASCDHAQGAGRCGGP
jgi:hypothetical protein